MDGETDGRDSSPTYSNVYVSTYGVEFTGTPLKQN